MSASDQSGANKRRRKRTDAPKKDDDATEGKKPKLPPMQPSTLRPLAPMPPRQSQEPPMPPRQSWEPPKPSPEEQGPASIAHSNTRNDTRPAGEISLNEQRGTGINEYNNERIVCLKGYGPNTTSFVEDDFDKNRVVLHEAGKGCTLVLINRKTGRKVLKQPKCDDEGLWVLKAEYNKEIFQLAELPAREEPYLINEAYNLADENIVVD